MATPTPVPPQAPAVTLAVVAPPTSAVLPTAQVAETSKPAPLTLGALERMALNSAMARSQTPAGTVQPCSYPEKADDQIVDMPSAFVDLVVPALVGAAGKPVTPTNPAEAQYFAQEYRIINSVRLRYYHLLALQKLIAVREDLANVSRDAVTAIDAMTAAGQATKAELLQARVEAREQMAALDSARAVHQAVWRRMAAAIGQPNLPVGPLAGDVEQCCTMPGFEVAWAHLLTTSPELQAVRGEVALRQASLRQSLAGSAGKAPAGEKPIPDGFISQALAYFNGPAPNRNSQVKQAAWTDLSRWEAEVGWMEQSLKQRLTEAYARFDRAKEVAELYRSQNLPDAKEAFELSVIGYRQGRGSWPQVQIAQRNYFRMSTEYVEALADLRRSELVILGLVIDGPEESSAQR